MSCVTCYRDGIEKMIEKASEHLEVQAEPLLDMGLTQGELYLHNAYIMCLRCQNKGCYLTAEIEAILYLDRVKQAKKE